MVGSIRQLSRPSTIDGRQPFGRGRRCAPSADRWLHPHDSAFGVSRGSCPCLFFIAWVREVIIKPMWRPAALRSCLYIADGKALGPPDSRRHRPNRVDLDWRVRTEVLLFRRSLWSLRSTRERQRKLGSVNRALGAGANRIATTGVVGVGEPRPTASGHLPCRQSQHGDAFEESRRHCHP